MVDCGCPILAGLIAGVLLAGLGGGCPTRRAVRVSYTRHAMLRGCPTRHAVRRGCPNSPCDAVRAELIVLWLSCYLCTYVGCNAQVRTVIDAEPTHTVTSVDVRELDAALALGGG